ncbi:pseudouridylate synthase [Tannerella forsythia]|uniref:Pseudouridylate synthase n=1 Tax=Tannerella forsythia TaxID=28112 RepID=A0A3P1YST3_TANFO|nr:pseudouridylate synthase [Tannerella forsythia]RRD73745.1 pseudouridylate synthase [Tannerella forsythia]
MIKDFDILELIPQRPPFVMVDKLTHDDETSTRSTFTVREGNLFCTDGGRMEEAGLIENMAQTCAARMGYRSRTEPQSDGTVRVGFIGAIRGITIVRAPLVGEVLTTTVEVMEEIFSTSLVETKVEVGDEVIASGSMKIFLTDQTEPSGVR